MSRHSVGIGALKRSGIVLCKDLSLLVLLYIAHFIVWRTLRRRRRERAARRKQMRLIHGGLRAEVGERRAVRLTGFNEERLLREELAGRVVRECHGHVLISKIKGD